MTALDEAELVKAFESIQQKSRKFTEENIQNPTVSDYLFVHNVMLRGFEMGALHGSGRTCSEIVEQMEHMER